MKLKLFLIFLLFVLPNAIFGQVNLNIKMFIEGYYTGNGIMNNVYLPPTGGLLYHVGASTNLNDVDTVWVSLMDPITYVQIEKQNSILQMNGTLSLTFNNVIIGNSYFIKVNHRNAIETWSANPVTLSLATTYDFTIQRSQAFGNNMSETIDHYWAFYNGDVNQDLVIDTLDYIEVVHDVYLFAIGYVVTDITGDGFVDSGDYGLEENNTYFKYKSISPLTIGINNPDRRNKSNFVKIFPNPSSGNCIAVFESGAKQLLSVRVFSLDGKKLSERIINDDQVNNNSIQLDFSELNSGIYFVQWAGRDFESNYEKLIIIKN